MTAKISSYQLAVLLFLSRLFTECINFPFEYSNYEMQRFTVVFITKILVFAVYIPLIIFSVKYPGESVFTATARKNKVLGWIVFVLMGAQMISEAVLCIIKLEFFTANTLLTAAPSWLLVALMSAVAVYGTLKGIQAVARMGTAVLILFFCMMILGTVSVSGDMNFNYLYPALIDTPSTLWSDIVKEFCKNNEFFIFLVLAGYVSKKPAKAIYIYVPFILICILFLTFLYTVTLGPYIGLISFPSYTLSSQFDIILFDRLDGLDVVIWTVTAVMKMIMFFICIRVMLASLIKEKTAKTASVVISVASCAVALYFTENYPAADFLFHEWEFLIIALILIILMPLAALFIKRSFKAKTPAAGGNINNSDENGGNAFENK